MSWRDKLEWLKALIEFAVTASRVKKGEIKDTQKRYGKDKGRVVRLIASFPGTSATFEKNVSIREGEIKILSDNVKPDANVKFSVDTLRALRDRKIWYAYEDGGGEWVEFTPAIAIENHYIIIEKFSELNENIVEDIIIFQKFFDLLVSEIPE